MTAGPPGGITFRGRGYEHRWSESHRHDFTPAGQDDRSAWRDMVTLHAHPAVRDDAGVAPRTTEQAIQTARTGFDYLKALKV